MSILDGRNQDQRCVSSPDPIHLLLGTGTEGLQGHCVNGMSSLTLDQLDKDSIKLSVKKETPLRLEDNGRSRTICLKTNLFCSQAFLASTREKK